MNKQKNSISFCHHCCLLDQYQLQSVEAMELLHYEQVGLPCCWTSASLILACWMMRLAWALGLPVASNAIGILVTMYPYSPSQALMNELNASASFLARSRHFSFCSPRILNSNTACPDFGPGMNSPWWRFTFHLMVSWVQVEVLIVLSIWRWLNESSKGQISRAVELEWREQIGMQQL